ncbi:MAG TPA: hypothetical protein VMH78_04445 [Thermoplasmata archaeon]|nr:hypothetical protein [Thermoplasmata archaeon]
MSVASRPPMGRLVLGNTLIGLIIVVSEGIVNAVLLPGASPLLSVPVSFVIGYVVALVVLWYVSPRVHRALRRFVQVTSFVAVPVVLWESVLNGAIFTAATPPLLRVVVSFVTGWPISFALILAGFRLTRPLAGPQPAPGAPAVE